MDLKELKKLYSEKKNAEPYISDGWHTMNELYFNRMILFKVILETYKDKAWKARQHHDGIMFDDMFIVGIDTPAGQYTYHYNNRYWDLFNVKELDKAPEYDGHQPDDIGRLTTLLGE